MYRLLNKHLLQSPENDPGEGGAGGTGGEPPKPPTEPPAPTGMTQEQVDRIVQDRLNRERAKFEQELKGLGYEGGIEGLRKQREEEQRKAEEAAKAKGEYEGLYKTAIQQKAELEAKLQEISVQRERQQVESAMSKAANGAVNPDQVARLVNMEIQSSGRSVVVRDGIAFVADASGSPVTDGQGGILTAEAVVQRFLADNPHFKPATTQGNGAGSRPGMQPPPSPQTKGFGHVETTDDVMQNREKILEALRRGEL